MILQRTLRPPAIEQHQECPIRPGEVRQIFGRVVMIESVHGSDPAAPVICQELTAVGDALSGQLTLFPLLSFMDPASGQRIKP